VSRPIRDFSDEPEAPDIIPINEDEKNLVDESIIEDDISTSTSSSSFEEASVNFSSFTIVEEVGSGAFGKVFKVIKNDTKQIYAMKALSK